MITVTVLAGEYYVAPQHIAWIGPICEGNSGWSFLVYVGSEMRFDYATRDEAEESRHVLLKAARFASLEPRD